MTDVQRASEQLVDSRGLQRVEHAVARILAETDRPVEVYSAVLETIGRALDWGIGAVWEVGQDGALRCIQTWHAGAGAPEFEALSARITLQRGVGLPGRVLASGQPTWIVDVPDDANFPRAEAARRTGLHAAFGFPLRSPRGVVGVIEFFSRELREPDERLLMTMNALGSEVGQFVVRRQAEGEVRERESRLRAMLESALDAVVTMDHRGRIVDWNHAAEATFGYRADEALGRDMADLIVPPSLRTRHREGLSRFLDTEHPVVLDRRLELTGLHKNGTEFPLELTITRIGIPGPPTFTGYLRDITDRKQAEGELRASRARLVEVADQERRRIQRNLHDGAQQRLTAALLQELRELASGLHPSILSQRGLRTALEALALRAPLTVELAAVPERRLPEQVEAAAYYLVAEALANVQKHAGAQSVVVHATADGGGLRVEVVDDGVGGADREGSGLRGLADRVEALGGRLSIESPPGAGTRLIAEIPASR
jgi:PAS domain S-box-containing protein